MDRTKYPLDLVASFVSWFYRNSET